MCYRGGEVVNNCCLPSDRIRLVLIQLVICVTPGVGCRSGVRSTRFHTASRKLRNEMFYMHVCNVCVHAFAYMYACASVSTHMHMWICMYATQTAPRPARPLHPPISCLPARINNRTRGVAMDVRVEVQTYRKRTD